MQNNVIPISSRIFTALVGIFLSKIDVIQVFSTLKTYTTTKNGYLVGVFMVLSIKTTLKYLLNSRFIIIYRFQPNSHSKMAAPPANTHTNPPTKSSKPYSPKSSLLAFWLVTSITSCVSSPLICASFSATYFILRLSFLLPRLGSGAIYGLSVSRTILSIGI